MCCCFCCSVCNIYIYIYIYVYIYINILLCVFCTCFMLFLFCFFPPPGGTQTGDTRAVRHRIMFFYVVLFGETARRDDAFVQNRSDDCTG